MPKIQRGTEKWKLGTTKSADLIVNGIDRVIG